jgi:hypothetical protein
MTNPFGQIEVAQLRDGQRSSIRAFSRRRIVPLRYLTEQAARLFARPVNRLGRNSPDMSAGYGPSITMVR